MTSIKTFIVICLLAIGLLSSCEGNPNMRGPARINFRIVNLTPEIIPTEDLHVYLQNAESRQYYEFSEFKKDNGIMLTMGARTSPSPQPAVKDPASWFGQEEVFVTNILVYRSDELLGSIKAQMETTKRNHNRVTQLISYTGFKSVELVLAPHPKEPSDEYWYYDSFKIKF